MMKRIFSSLLCPTEKVTEEQLATDVNLVNMGRSIAALNRRAFLARISAAGMAAGALSVAGLSLTPEAHAQSSTPSITDVLNFALNLEFLEANLYASVTGMTPPTGGPGVTNAPGKLTLDAQTMATAMGLYNDETHHIALLQSTITSLGGTPITQPAIDLSAGGTVTITTTAQFLAAARQFTAVGNSAYAGGAQYLISNTAVLTAAAQILGAEAQHMGAVNYLCCINGVASTSVDALDYPPVPPNTYFTITPTTDTKSPAVGPLRTTAEVLGIVYGVSTASTTTPPTGVVKGGFFPAGVNGNIVST